MTVDYSNSNCIESVLYGNAVTEDLL